MASALAGDGHKVTLLDSGDVVQLGVLANLTLETARAVRDAVGDCGACRLFFARLSALWTPGLAGAVRPLLAEEVEHYAGQLRSVRLEGLLVSLGLGSALERGSEARD